MVADFLARAVTGRALGDPACDLSGGDIRRALATDYVIGLGWPVVRCATVMGVAGFDPSFHDCNDWDFGTRAAAGGARLAPIVVSYRTVAGQRLVDDLMINAVDAGRALAHPSSPTWSPPDGHGRVAAPSGKP